jgi:hypothetical protein
VTHWGPRQNLTTLEIHPGSHMERTQETSSSGRKVEQIVIFGTPVHDHKGYLSAQKTWTVAESAFEFDLRWPGEYKRRDNIDTRRKEGCSMLHQSSEGSWSPRWCSRTGVHIDYHTRHTRKLRSQPSTSLESCSKVAHRTSIAGRLKENM